LSRAALEDAWAALLLLPAAGGDGERLGLGEVEGYLVVGEYVGE